MVDQPDLCFICEERETRQLDANEIALGKIGGKGRTISEAEKYGGVELLPEKKDFVTCCKGKFSQRVGLKSLDGNWKCKDKVFNITGSLKNENLKNVCGFLSLDAGVFHKDVVRGSWTGDENSYPLGKDCPAITCPTSDVTFLKSLGSDCQKKVEAALLAKQKTGKSKQAPLIEE